MGDHRNYKELFNHRHSSLHMCVERVFGILKGRFKILSTKPFFPYIVFVVIVFVCCIVHNYILGKGGDSLNNVDEEWLGVSWMKDPWITSMPRSQTMSGCGYARPLPHRCGTTEIDNLLRFDCLAVWLFVCFPFTNCHLYQFDFSIVLPWSACITWRDCVGNEL